MHFLLLIKRNGILSFSLSFFVSFLAIGDISSLLGGFSEFLCCGNSAVLPGDCGCVWNRNGSHLHVIPKEFRRLRVWNSRKVTLCVLVEYLVLRETAPPTAAIITILEGNVRICLHAEDAVCRNGDASDLHSGSGWLEISP